MSTGTDPETEIEVTIPSDFWSQIGEELLIHQLDHLHGNKILMTNDMLVIAFNNGSTSPHSLVISSQPDSETGRQGDIDVEIETGEFRVFRLMKRGWADSEGYLLFPAGQSEHLYIGVVKIR
jgi:hypothetical protein